MVDIYTLPKEEYIEKFKEYGMMKHVDASLVHSFLLSVFGLYPRGFCQWHTIVNKETREFIKRLEEIYINKDAFYFNEFDKKLLIAHEQGHIDGREHELFGLMNPFGPTRLIMCTLDPNKCGIKSNAKIDISSVIISGIVLYSLYILLKKKE